MALFDRKPLVVGGRVIFSPKDLSSRDKAILVAVKSLQILMMFIAVGTVAGLLAGLLRFTFDFPWSWGVFAAWGIAVGFASIFQVITEFLSWWWITDQEAQKFRDYYDEMSKKMEGFMKDNGVEYKPLPQDPITKKETTTTTEKDKAKVIHLPITTRKKPNDNGEEKS